MDKTLARSKEKITPSMAELLSQLLEKYAVAIISGGNYPQFDKQVVPFLKWDLCKLTIFPTSWAKMYTYDWSKWVQKYSEDINEEKRQEVIDRIAWAVKELNYTPEKTWGELIEDRTTQITYSALWQEAPVEEKEAWDPTLKKKKAIQELVAPFFPDLQVNLWWATSIDVTQKWVDKWYGMQKIISYGWYTKEDILFVWDAIYPWGNDYPPMEMWIDCIKTSWPDETETIIKNILHK